MGARTSEGGSKGTSCGLLFVRLAKASASGLGEALESIGLTATEYAILHLLAETGPVSQQGIGRGLRIHPSNLVATLDDFEAAGLVIRPRDPADRRRYLVGLTEEGSRALARARAAVEHAERELLAPLSEAEARELHALLGRLAGHSCRAVPRAG